VESGNIPENGMANWVRKVSMTVEEAIGRAKPKIEAKTFDDWDLRNLLESVYSQGFSEGRRLAVDQMRDYLERKANLERQD
jgi:hypothetical protein